MKYFLLTLSRSCRFIPVINHQKSINRLLSTLADNDAFLNLPSHYTIPVVTQERTVWTDILDSPVFLISDKIMEVIRLYGDYSRSKDVILLDGETCKSKIYYLSKFEQARGTIGCHNEGSNRMNILISENNKINKWSNIFQILVGRDKYIVVNLDFAESLLRRNIIGVGLEEIELVGI